ncbi:MAG: Hsp20/alpha crystallin family protein [Saprospiraceae bacterium]
MKKANGTGLVPTFKSWLDDFWGADNVFADDFLRMRKNWMPAVNIKDEKKNFEIEVAAPGLKKEDFKIRVENGMLFISAEREDTREETEAAYTRKEFSYHSFERSFALPENADPESISARYNDGILKLTVKKMKTAATPKTIAVS